METTIYTLAVSRKLDIVENEWREYNPPKTVRMFICPPDDSVVLQFNIVNTETFDSDWELFPNECAVVKNGTRLDAEEFYDLMKGKAEMYGNILIRRAANE